MATIRVWFRDLSIVKKLVFGFGVVGVTGAAMFGFGLLAIEQMESSNHLLYQHGVQSLDQVTTLTNSFQCAMLAMRDTARAPKDQVDSQIEVRKAYSQLISQSLAKIEELNDDASVEQVLTDLKENRKALLADITKFEGLMQEGRRAEAEAVLYGDDMQATAGRENDLVAKLSTQVTANAGGAEEGAVRVMRKAKVAMMLLAAFGALLALFLTWVIVREIGEAVRELRRAAERVAQGDAKVQIEIESSDEFGQLAESLRMVAAMFQSRAEAAERIAAGDLTQEIKVLSQEDVLGKSLALMRAELQQVLSILHGLTGALRDGDLQQRVDAGKFRGSYGEIIAVLNQMMEAVNAPVTVTKAYIERISRGDIPPKITDEYKGAFGELKNSLNLCIDGLAGLVEANGVLQRMAVNDLTRKVDGRYEGVFAEVASATNQVRDRIRDAVKVCGVIARGEFEAELQELKRTGKRSEADEFVPGFIQAMESIEALVRDTGMLFHAAVEGRLDQRANAAGHQGRYREVVEGVNKTLDAMVRPMREVTSVLNCYASGDLTSSITASYSGDFEGMTSAVNTVGRSVSRTLQVVSASSQALLQSAEDLLRVSAEMTSTADQTTTRATAVSAGSEQVSRNVQTVAAGAGEMGVSIREIAKSTAEASKVATGAVSTAEATNATVAKLGTSSAEIGQVIKVITTIAEQTNLLALNATIEAARAGEAGKGFAVVANEVKDLAKETARATEDIGRRVEAIQSDTRSAVDAIGEIGSVISQINDIQGTIAGAIEEQSATTAEISRTLEEAARGAVEISRNINGVADAAQNTSKGASEMQKAAQRLDKMATELEQAIARFKFRATSAAAQSRIGRNDLAAVQ